MKSIKTQYIFAGLFLLFAIYQVVIRDYAEFALYGLAGIAFIVTALSTEPSLAAHKRLLAIASWILIITTGLVFLYLLQFKYL